LRKATKQNIELPALAITAVLKFLLMDWLQWRAVYITGICLFWFGYVLFQVKSDDQLNLWGFRASGFKKSLFLLTPVIFAGIVVPLVYAGFKNNLVFTWHIIPVLFLYPVWGIIQQFLMLGIILQNLLTLFDKRVNRYVIVLIVSALFSLIHYTSFFLMIFTFFMEILFIIVYLKWKNLWAIGIAHGWIASFLLFYVLERNLWQELFSGY
jgi:uncharacterized protein